MSSCVRSWNPGYPSSSWSQSWVYLVARFQSPQLPSTQSESAPKSHGSFKVCTQLWMEFKIFHISIQINCNRISECLLHIGNFKTQRYIFQYLKFCLINITWARHTPATNCFCVCFLPPRAPTIKYLSMHCSQCRVNLSNMGLFFEKSQTLNMW
jgi:hypothetical protein